MKRNVTPAIAIDATGAPLRLGKVQKFILLWSYKQHWPLVKQHSNESDGRVQFPRLMKSNMMAAYARDVLGVPLPKRFKHRGTSLPSVLVSGLMDKAELQLNAEMNEPNETLPKPISRLPTAKEIESVAMSQAYDLSGKLSRTFSKALRSLTNKGLIRRGYSDHKSDQRGPGAKVSYRAGIALTPLGAAVAKNLSGLGSPDKFSTP